MRVVAIDPGYQQSAYVVWDGSRVLEHGIEENEVFVSRLQGAYALALVARPAVVIEQVESYGMAVGREVFGTVFAAGRMYQAMHSRGCVTALMPRRAVKLHLCHSAKAKDSNIRQALIDRFGGKDKAIGKKASPGPLYGIRADEWQALALGVTWWDQQKAQEATA